MLLSDIRHQPLKTSFLLRSLLSAALLPFLANHALAADVSATWLGGNGNWGNATLWDTNPNFPNNGNGGFTYDATINSGTATLDRNIAIQRLFLNGGGIDGSFNLTLNDGLSWTGGTIAGSPGTAVELPAKSTSTFSGTDPLTLNGRTINNSGTVSEIQSVDGDGAINNLAGATWDIQAGANGNNAPSLSPAIFNNSGNFIVSGGLSDFSNTNVTGVFNNSGTVTIQSNTAGGAKALAIGGDGMDSGAFNVAAGTQLNFLSRPLIANSYTLTMGATISGAGSTYNGTSLIIAGNSTIGTSLLNQGTVTVQSGATLTLNGNLQQFPLSTIRLAGGTVATSTLSVGLGTLDGSGMVSGNATVFRGTIYPSDPGSDGCPRNHRDR